MEFLQTIVDFFVDILKTLFEFAPVSGTLGLLFAVIYVPKRKSIAKFRKDMHDYYYYKYTTRRPLGHKIAYRLMWPLFKLDDLISAIVSSWWSVVQGIGRAGLLFVAFVIAGKTITTIAGLVQPAALEPAAQSEPIDEGNAR
jgi:hypothetical protein